MISFRWNQTRRLLQIIIGGRHIRRPYFDFGLQTCRNFKFSRSYLPNGGGLREYVTCSVDRRLTRFLVFDSIPSLFQNIIINRTVKKSTVAMALNKLSIDKIELTDKRVLIRYVFSDKNLMKYKRSYKKVFDTSNTVLKLQMYHHAIVYYLYFFISNNFF